MKTIRGEVTSCGGQRKLIPVPEPQHWVFRDTIDYGTVARKGEGTCVCGWRVHSVTGTIAVGSLVARLSPAALVTLG